MLHLYYIYYIFILYLYTFTNYNTYITTISTKLKPFQDVNPTENGRDIITPTWY